MGSSAVAIDDVDHELETAGDAVRAIAVDQMPCKGTIEVESDEVKTVIWRSWVSEHSGWISALNSSCRPVSLNLTTSDEGSDAGQNFDLIGTAVERVRLTLDVRCRCDAGALNKIPARSPMSGAR